MLVEVCLLYHSAWFCHYLFSVNLITLAVIGSKTYLYLYKMYFIFVMKYSSFCFQNDFTNYEANDPWVQQFILNVDSLMVTFKVSLGRDLVVFFNNTITYLSTPVNRLESKYHEIILTV